MAIIIPHRARPKMYTMKEFRLRPFQLKEQMVAQLQPIVLVIQRLYFMAKKVVGGKLSKRIQTIPLSSEKWALLNLQWSICSTRTSNQIIGSPVRSTGDTDSPQQHPEAFMLVCGSCNRAKFWSLRNTAPIWLIQRSSCMYKLLHLEANPVTYQHVATQNVRRTNLIWGR